MRSKDREKLNGEGGGEKRREGGGGGRKKGIKDR